MALDFLRPGAPRDQPVGDLRAAKSAIFVGVVNGMASPSYLQPCLCHGGGAAAAGEAGGYYGLYLLANLATAMLGVALLVVGMAFSATVVRSPAWHPVLRWMVWAAKVLTGGTLQFGLSVLHSCLRMCAAFVVVFA